MLNFFLLLLISFLPQQFLTFILKILLYNSALALCLHRISFNSQINEMLQPELIMDFNKLQKLALLLTKITNKQINRIYFTFDDGYSDAINACLKLAPLFPNIIFICYICPEKASLQTGFRWDLYTKNNKDKPLSFYMEENKNIYLENLRTDLQNIAKDNLYKIATIDECKQLLTYSNCLLGCHTNCHFMLNSLNNHDATIELERSIKSFDDNFHYCEHFAFPFGSPEYEISIFHVDIIKKIRPLKIWSTEARPFLLTEYNTSKVLPRFPVMCNWQYKKIIAWIILYSIKYKFFGTKFKNYK